MLHHTLRYAYCFISSHIMTGVCPPFTTRALRLYKSTPPICTKNFEKSQINILPLQQTRTSYSVSFKTKRVNGGIFSFCVYNEGKWADIACNRQVFWCRVGLKGSIIMSDGINFAALGIFETTSTGNNDEDAVVIAEPTVAERVGRLEARGIDDATICDMFQLSASELEQLRATDDYKPALAAGQQQQVERPLRVDDSWDDVEDVALHKLRSTVHNEYDTDRLLKIAAVANRAARRSDRAKGGQIDISDAQSSVVHLNLSPRFIQQLNIINPQQEHSRIAKLAKGNKMVDYLPQGEFEKAIADNVNNDVEDVLQDAVAMLDTMVLNK